MYEKGTTPRPRPRPRPHPLLFSRFGCRSLRRGPPYVCYSLGGEIKTHLRSVFGVRLEEVDSAV